MNHKILSLIVLQLFAFNLFSQDLNYDEDFLQSLPDSVRKDVEDELKQSTEKEQKNFKRPSSKLSKLDTVKKWEMFLENESNKVIESDRLGLSFFRTMQTSFMPINEPNFDGNYIIDFGDVLSFNIIGDKSIDYQASVSRDGSVFVENVGKVFISGLSLDQATSLIREKFNSVFIGQEIFISLTEVRDIQVLITGESFAPGIYTLNGNTNIFHALSMSGGITENGSLRNIQVKRSGELISSFDAYDAIFYGNVKLSNKIQSGDSIVIDSVQNLVRISGAVKRPGLFELKDDENLYDLLNLANGFSANRSPDSIYYMYYENGISKKTIIEDKSDLKEIQPVDGSVLYVPELKKEFVEILGEVKNPGVYQISNNETLSSLIKKSGGYNLNSYPLGGILFNNNAKEIEEVNAKRSYNFLIRTLANSVISPTNNSSDKSIIEIAELLSSYINSDFMGRIQAEFDLIKIEDNKVLDTYLSDGDKIIIPKTTDQIYVFGEVAQEGAKRFDDDLHYMEYIISHSGGFTKFADKESIYVIHPNGTSKKLSSSFTANLFNKIDYELYPGSVIYVSPKTITNIQNLSLLAPVVSSLALTAASLQSISSN